MARSKKTSTDAISPSVVISNNDIIYLWWQVSQKINGCLGFSIHRIVDGREQALPATVGFNVAEDKRKSPQTTDQWPVQSFNWKDLYAPHDKDIRYRIIPMVGEWDDLKPDMANVILTGKVRRTQQYGDMKVIFNRGLLSTQAFAKRKGGVEGVDSQADARKILEDPDNVWRKRLGGQMLFNVEAFFNKGNKEGGKFYGALYELTDKKLIEYLCGAKHLELILSNANSSKTRLVDGKMKTISVNDGTNAKVRKALKKLMEQGKLTVHHRMLGTHIGHNKFIVYVDNRGKARSVLTGSTNWTATGLCGQTNNMVFIESEEIAARYLEYWNQLKDDTKQGPGLRNWCSLNGDIYSINNKRTDAHLWFSPNTKLANKPKKDPETPVDMETVYSLIENAKKSILFLVFNPGSPSILNKITEVAEKRQEQGKRPLFVRGAISDAKIARQVTTDIYSRNILNKPDRYLVTGVAAIPGPFSYFEKELLKLGFATIHDKILVIDPFEKDCVAITGSHNLGFKASYSNDENMIIIQKDCAIAQAYAAHVLDVVNHFKWRYKLQSKLLEAGAKTNKEKEKVLKEQWNDLDETDGWMDYYFGSKGFKHADQLFLPTN